MASNIHQQFSYQGSFAEQPTPSKPELSAGIGITLLVRHLPESIPHDMLAQLFSYYGASSFRQCPGGSLRNCAFVEFKDETSASLAHSQLNRLKFHKKVLSVERVRNTALADKGQQGQVHPFNESSCKPALPLEDIPVSGNTKGSPSNPAPRSEPIAPKLGVDYPFPPFLEYNYPPPDGNILTNIVNTLIAVPRFYTQVLHLMNKMNIPAPFRMALPMPPLPPPVPAPPPPPPPNIEEPPPPDISSEESEMESSDEEVDGVLRKRRKLEAIVGPAVDKGVAHEDVGLRPASLVPKEVPLIKKKNPIMQIKIAPKTSQTEIKTRDGITTQVTETSKDVEAKSFATPEEIEFGKLPLEEILSLPKFKAYAAGSPNSVLYIKNLAKDVVMDDFYFIFGSFFASSEAARAGLNIKLMQEGRMRDQAFVTFPSVDLAHRALELVNGYVFKGKPMVIQFGRKPDNKTN